MNYKKKKYIDRSDYFVSDADTINFLLKCEDCNKFYNEKEGKCIHCK